VTFLAKWLLLKLARVDVYTNDMFEMALDMNKCHFFDLETELRIKPENKRKQLQEEAQEEVVEEAQEVVEEQAAEAPAEEVAE